MSGQQNFYSKKGSLILNNNLLNAGESFNFDSTIFKINMPAKIFILLLLSGINSTLKSQGNTCCYGEKSGGHLLIPSLNACKDHISNELILCTPDCKFIPVPEKAWKSSFGHQIIKLTLPLTVSYTWKEISAPEGAEPTCFFEDSKGTFWMGTGSSGGIFYSKNKGRTWTVRNEGIGPWHISRIQEVRDTLFMNAPLKGTFYWSDSKKKWVHTDGEVNSGYHWEMIDAAQGNDSYFVDILEPVFAEPENVPPYQFRLQRFMWNSYDYHSHSHQYFATTDNMLVGFRMYGEEDLKIDFSNNPIPLNYLESSAFYLLKDSSIIIIGRNALYQVKNKRVSRLGLKGLTATDVRQIVATKNGNYALVGCCEIWCEKNGVWKRVFSPAYNDTLYYNIDEPSPGRIDRLWEAEYGLFQFGCGGKIYNMNENGKVSLVTQLEEILVLRDEYEDSLLFYPMQELTFGLEISYLIGVSASGDIPGLYMNYGNSVQLLSEVPDNTFLYRSAWGRVLICNNQGIQDVEGYDPEKKLSIEDYDYIDPSLFTEDEAGNIYFYGAVSDLLYYYDLKSQTVVSISVNAPENFSPSVLHYDPEWGIFCGTGHEYNYSCGDFANEKASGLYRLEKSGSEYAWKKIEGEPNPAIFSIIKDGDGFLIGTSGSGFVRLEVK